MSEPTHSYIRGSLNFARRFCDAMIQIRKEAEDIITGKQPKDNNVLKNAPHPISVLTVENWDKPYTREAAAYPVPGLRERKFWPTVSRIDDAYGDLHLIVSSVSCSFALRALTTLHSVTARRSKKPHLHRRLTRIDDFSLGFYGR